MPITLMSEEVEVEMRGMLRMSMNLQVVQKIRLAVVEAAVE